MGFAVISDAKTWEKLFDILEQERPDQTVYVYRVDFLGRVVKPYLLKTFPYAGLPDSLRDDYGGGDFRVMIREGRTLIFSGVISIDSPLRRFSQ